VEENYYVMVITTNTL